MGSGYIIVEITHPLWRPRANTQLKDSRIHILYYSTTNTSNHGSKFMRPSKFCITCVTRLFVVIHLSVLMTYWPEAFGKHAIMTFTYELPHYLILGTGIFASMYIIFIYIYIYMLSSDVVD